MATRSDKFTIETKKLEYYSDFLVNFDKNPVTGFMARVTNEEAVKQSIRNLVLTMRTERFYDPNIGSKVSALLFEPIDEITAEAIQREIRQTINNKEPRASLIEVIVNPQYDLNAYFITVVFSIINIPDQTFNLDLILRRIR